MTYLDSKGYEIEAGMVLVHEDGEEQEVFACGDDDLGFNASNPDFLRAHPEATRQYYPLYQFNTREWKIK